MPAHTERAFEAAIEYHLTSHGGYERRAPSDYAEELALFPGDVCGFLRESQPRKWGALPGRGKHMEATVLESLVKELESKGTLHVLRHGFKCYGKTFAMAFFRPNTSMNPDAEKAYARNRLTITRQVAFPSVLKAADGRNRRCIIDVTLAVNGIPVVTAELKNPMTGQCAADAVRQYKQERDGRDLLFVFKQRALVHFALDPDAVWMTTQLNGQETRFLPFNRGNNNGAGNPPVQGTCKTHYLWDEVLQADSLLEILQRFMHLDVRKKRVKTGKGTRTVRKERMIFPRYHQLDAVRALVAHAKTHGAGRNYLIQHSAGSGKSNSIAWLAHRLASLHNEHDEKVFHSVVVVTDRRVLDQQLQQTIYQFEHKNGVVEKIDEDTRQLAQALSQGTPIVITTIQKFPFISRALSTLEKQGSGVKIDTAGKRFAVIVDEAHSSQSGEAATALRGMLNKDGIESAIAAQISGEEEDYHLSDDAKAAMRRDALKRGRQPNLSFFAFTATPKFKTIALFNEPGPSGAAPFHTYTMRQAIEEGFIMDVLQNYTTYKRFFGLLKQVKDDPDVPRRQAARALTLYMELHPFNIGQVISVIVEHFRLSVMHELGGRAKAMVVTGSRLEAVKYKLAFDRYIQEQRYTGIRSLVAFSGTVENPDDHGLSYTEVQMNDGLAESELPEAFERDDYRVLLVAEKYQTGFDQPLLQTMYVVKRLAGVQAVQTLSRLNRIAPGKSRTFVLDFVNEQDDIYEAFKPYYESTPVGKSADPQCLSELQHQLLQWAIFAQDDVIKFTEIWYRSKRQHSISDHGKMNAILDPLVHRFKDREEEEQEQFRGQLKGYRNTYAFLSQIIPYQDTDLERFYTFVRNLLAKLPSSGDGQAFVLDDDVVLRFFRLQQMSDQSIRLSEGQAKPLKGPTDLGTASAKEEEVMLSSLIDRLNERFGTDFNNADQLFVDQIQASAENDERVTEAARVNNFSDFAAFLNRRLDDLCIARMEGNEDLLNRVLEAGEFRSTVHEYLAREIFSHVRGNHGRS